MNKSLLVKTLANTKWSNLPEELLTEIFFLLKEQEKTPKEVCSQCGYTRFALFHANNYKMCLGCWNKVDWFLSKRQKPLIQHQR